MPWSYDQSMRSRNITLPMLLSAGLVVLPACTVSGEQRPQQEPISVQNQSARALPPQKIQDTQTTQQQKSQQKNLYLQPLGRQLPEKAVTLVEEALVEFYGFNIKRAPPTPLPRFAYYQPRKRYRAEKLLDFLRQTAPDDAFRILGLTAVDISTTAHGRQDWGIMGLASIDGRVSLMSMFRCRRGSRSKAHARERLGKVAVHEVGHTLGLEHCPTHGCLMEDARGTNTTTDREYLLCSRCRAYLERRGYMLPPDPHPPWSRPL